MKKKSIVYISILLFSLTGMLNAQAHNLKYKLVVGEHYRFYQSTELNITQSIGSVEQEVNNNFQGVTRFTPVSITPDKITLKVAFESLSIQIKSLFFNVLYDSELPVEKTDNIGQVYNGIINKEFTMVITPLGKVISVSGMDDIINESADKLIYASERTVEQIKKSLESHFGEEALKGNMEMLLSIYPETAKSVNQTWQTETKLTSSLQADMHSNWTFESDNNNTWVISSVGDISAEAEEAQMNGMDMRFNLNGTNQSQYTMSSKDGWFEKGWQKQHVSGFIEMLAGHKSTKNMQVPMSVSSKTYIERR